MTLSAFRLFIITPRAQKKKKKNTTDLVYWSWMIIKVVVFPEPNGKAGTKFQNENLKIQENVLEIEYFTETWHKCYLESCVWNTYSNFSIIFFVLFSQI